MSEGWMWQSVGPTEAVIREGARLYMLRHCRFASWVRASTRTLGGFRPTELDGVRIIVDETITPWCWLYGVNGGQDSGAVAPERPCNSCNMGSESERGTN